MRTWGPSAAGIRVAETVDQALAAITDMFGGAFGAAGAEVVIEDFMAVNNFELYLKANFYEL